MFLCVVLEAALFPLHTDLIKSMWYYGIFVSPPGGWFPFMLSDTNYLLSPNCCFRNTV